MTDKYDEAAAEFLEDAFGLEPMDDQPEIVRLANMLRDTHNAVLGRAPARPDGLVERDQFDESAKLLWKIARGLSSPAISMEEMADILRGYYNAGHNAALDEAARQAVNFHESPTLIPKVIRDLKVRP